MEKALPVFFYKDVSIDDARHIADWLGKERVTKYLNEDNNIVESIGSLINSESQTLLTYHFNKIGRFYILSEGNTPIGFVNLIDRQNANEYEIVLVIGEEQLWGKGYGRSAVKQCLNMVFFEWRAKKITAKIHHNNIHSLHLFSKAGFKQKTFINNLYVYQITFDEYIASILKK